MSASLRSAAPIGVRQPATDHGQMAVSEQRPVKQGHPLPPGPRRPRRAHGASNSDWRGGATKRSIIRAGAGPYLT